MDLVAVQQSYPQVCPPVMCVTMRIQRTSSGVPCRITELVTVSLIKSMTNSFIQTPAILMNPPVHLPEEADIGSGEKTPGQTETEKMIGQIPAQKNQQLCKSSPKDQHSTTSEAQAGTPLPEASQSSEDSGTSKQRSSDKVI